MLNIGDIVISKQGHDKKDILVIIELVNERFVLVSDGLKRTIQNPKLKNIKHLKVLESSEELANKIKNGSISDTEIAQRIKTLI